ncbi:hypothetical protein CAC42_6155 [Sphaceloma murrayae]|uniref:Uncharacterized protein n=1 Tax=Sphaceloma murrayae TaxID=2082308 RepID=A0A2K1QTE2_9PEZI|nr:hypothetical protein CAC42_6155 [Sphaceloma murrayae]
MVSWYGIEHRDQIPTWDFIVETMRHVPSPRVSFESVSEVAPSQCRPSIFRPKLKRMTQRSIDALCRLRVKENGSLPRSIAMLRQAPKRAAAAVANAGAKVSLTPCGGQAFACGLNTTACTTGSNIVIFERPSALVLRPSQIAALLKVYGPNTTTSTPQPQNTSATQPLYIDGQRMYPSSVVLALGLAMGFSLAFLLISVIVMYRKLRTRAPKVMYDPPDQPAVPMVARSISSRPSTSSMGRSPTIHTLHSTHTLHEPAAMPRSFLDRYAQKAKDPEVHEIDMGNPRYELGTTHAGRTPSRAELNGSQPGDGWKKVTREPIGY